MFRVLKFGGSSVAGATAVSRVLDIVSAEKEKGTLILVSSAISGCTDALLRLGQGKGGSEELLERHLGIIRRLFTGSEREAVEAEIRSLFREMEAAQAEEKVTFGELFSTRILAKKLCTDGIRAHWLDSRKLIVKGNLPLSYQKIRQAVRETDTEVFVAPGFICSDADGKPATLGRGGSDYSAAIFAAALGAASLQIWTDVPGIMTANPKEVPAARTIPRLSYAAALDMAEHGAKVLYAPTVAPAMDAGLDIEIRNTFDPEGKRSVISAAPDAGEWVGVTAEGGTLRIVGTPLADGGRGAKKAAQALHEDGIAALSLARDGNDIVIHIREAIRTQALRALHARFFTLRDETEICLFIAGTGAVGTALVSLAERTAERIAAHSGKRLRISGLSNSRRYGIDLCGKPELVREGDYINAVIAAAPIGSIFVDCTDSKTLWQRYPELFAAGVGIVSSNRRSFAIPYADYAALHRVAREHGVPLRYETTVGAALPILSTMAVGATSCDEIQAVEAVVSCTLNQILSNYSGEGVPLAVLVRRAQENGLTEKDPRTDLSGQDALRKLLILARVAGIPLEASDVQIEPAVPLTEGPIEDFYASLSSWEATFAARVRKAAEKGCRIRFVASLSKDGRSRLGYRATIRLQDVPLSHPAYFLEGTENAIILQSTFHPYPLVIQGSGEGAMQAASSILNEILR